MRLIRSIITLVILSSFLRRSSSVASCCHLSATSTCHIFQPYQTACQEHAYHFSPTFLLIATHRRSFCAGVVRFLQAAFFSLVSLVTSNWTQDLLNNDIVHVLQNTILVHKFRHRSTRLCVGTHVFTKVSEITQYNGHYVVQGHSRSPISVPIESSYTTSY